VEETVAAALDASAAVAAMGDSFFLRKNQFAIIFFH
jgi:hypothetical protein